MNFDRFEGLKDFHMHTTYCDGANTVEEMIQAGIEKGMTAMGFSGHSHTPFDESYCMAKDEVPHYAEEVREMAEKYSDKITVLCGIEQDYYSIPPKSGEWDYVIGSVHYIKVPVPEGIRPASEEPMCNREPGIYEIDGFAYIPMDEEAEIISAAADRYFEGDIYALTEEYFRTVARVVDRTGADIIGHLDLVAKLNKGGEIDLEDGGLDYEPGPLFDESHPRYIAAWKRAVDMLILSEVPFEINTGAVTKGYRTDPYPSAPIREYIKAKGGKFIMSSDSHTVRTLLNGFDEEWL